MPGSPPAPPVYLIADPQIAPDLGDTNEKGQFFASSLNLYANTVKEARRDARRRERARLAAGVAVGPVAGIIVTLGDLVQGEPVECTERDLTSVLDAALAEEEEGGAGGRIVSVIIPGNHDMGGGHAVWSKVMREREAREPPGSFVVAAPPFVSVETGSEELIVLALDTTERSLGGGEEAERAAAAAFLADHPDAKPWNGTMGDASKEALFRRLAEEREREREGQRGRATVLLLAHHPLTTPASSARHVQLDGDSFAERLAEAAGPLCLFFVAGHFHVGGSSLEPLPQLTVPAVLEEPQAEDERDDDAAHTFGILFLPDTPLSPTASLLPLPGTTLPRHVNESLPRLAAALASVPRE
jgi:hypothetical protein